MFNKFGTITRFRYPTEGKGEVLHHGSSSFIIKDLGSFFGRRMTLDMVSIDRGVRHAHVKLVMAKPIHGLTTNSEESIVIERITTNELALDFVSMQRIKKINLQEGYKFKNNGRMRLRIDTDPGLYEEISNIIRHKEPKHSPELRIAAVGFPIYKNPYSKTMTITFEGPIPYYLEELRLFNGTESISPYSRHKEEFHMLCINFDLNNFTNRNNGSLKLICTIFNKEVSVGNIENIKKMYLEEDVPHMLIPEPESYFENKPLVMSLDPGTKRHMENCGKIIRFRYDSEINEGSKSSLSKFNIRNLQQFVGLKILLDIVNWGSDTDHLSLQFHLTKQTHDFVVTDGKFEGTIQKDKMSLNFLCIKRGLKRNDDGGNDSDNCRIRMRIGSETIEISNLIRHLCPNVSETLQNPSVSFPYYKTGLSKFMQISFSKYTAYNNNELELRNGEVIIQAEDLKRNKPLHIVEFDLSKFSCGIRGPLQLCCPSFKRIWDLPVENDLTNIYPEMVSELNVRSCSQLSFEPSTSSSKTLITSNSQISAKMITDGKELTCPSERKNLKRDNSDKLFPKCIGFEKRQHIVCYKQKDDEMMVDDQTLRPDPERDKNISPSFSPESNFNDSDYKIGLQNDEKQRNDQMTIDDQTLGPNSERNMNNYSPFSMDSNLFEDVNERDDTAQCLDLEMTEYKTTFQETFSDMENIEFPCLVQDLSIFPVGDLYTELVKTDPDFESVAEAIFRSRESLYI